MLGFCPHNRYSLWGKNLTEICLPGDSEMGAQHVLTLKAIITFQLWASDIRGTLPQTTYAAKAPWQSTQNKYVSEKEKGGLVGPENLFFPHSLSSYLLTIHSLKSGVNCFISSPSSPGTGFLETHSFSHVREAPGRLLWWGEKPARQHRWSPASHLGPGSHTANSRGGHGPWFSRGPASNPRGRITLIAPKGCFPWRRLFCFLRVENRNLHHGSQIIRSFSARLGRRQQTHPVCNQWTSFRKSRELRGWSFLWRVTPCPRSGTWGPGWSPHELWSLLRPPGLWAAHKQSHVSLRLESSVVPGPEHLSFVFSSCPQYIVFDKLAKASSSLKGSEPFLRIGIYPAPYEFIN